MTPCPNVGSEDIEGFYTVKGRKITAVGFSALLCGNFPPAAAYRSGDVVKTGSPCILTVRPLALNCHMYGLYRFCQDSLPYRERLLYGNMPAF